MWPSAPLPATAGDGHVDAETGKEPDGEMPNAIPHDLSTLATAEGLGDWMFEQFADAIDGDVVEVGAGIGTFTARILELPVRRLLLLEPDPACASVLAGRFGSDPHVELARESLPGSRRVASGGPFDFVLCQNVLEHIPDDAGAVASMASCLRPGGRLGLLVPANPRLYGRLDRAYDHQRRYSPAGLRRLLEQAGLTVEDLYSFNLLGVLGWWYQNRRRSPRIAPGAIRAYERILKLWRPIETRWRPPRGLSLIARARLDPRAGPPARYP